MIPYRIIFMGTPEFSVPTLMALHEGQHEIVAARLPDQRGEGRGECRGCGQRQGEGASDSTVLLSTEAFGDDHRTDNAGQAEAGTLQEIQSRGHVRTVGRDHEIHDGDVVEFFFSG